MNKAFQKPDISRVLDQLKDFQRSTVDHVFQRMYLDQDCTTKFLVSDEVGLGKTLVARGVIAKTIDYLWDKVDRLDVVYVCSNGDIARQNINRLNVTGEKDFSLSSRITLLPLQIRELQKKKLNFVSFTPGTSFDLKGNVGQSKERQLLYWLLKDFIGYSFNKGTSFFTGYADIERFRWNVEWFEVDEINPEIKSAFLEQMQQDTDLTTRLNDALEETPRAYAEWDPAIRKQVNSVIGSLRKLLAETCLNKLEPDLIILDEFQRFKDLLQGDKEDASEAALLAKQLFEFQLRADDPATAARVLLLSATPYKMYTVKQESEENNHYEDFQRTIEFLMPKNQLNQFNDDLGDYRKQLLRIVEHGVEGLAPIKKRLEASLKKYMVRTERLATGDDRDGMLRQINYAPQVSAKDIRAYLSLQKVAGEVESRGVLEYWKSAPYLLNFMEAYDIKRRLIKRVEKDEYDVELRRAIKASKPALLDRSAIESYKDIDQGNARLRSLHGEIIENGAWKLLWIPPSLPYYKPGGHFAAEQLQGFTKKLIFSNWQVVPKAIASMLSYSAEKNMVRTHEKSPENTVEARKSRRPLIRFSTSEGRLAAMSAMTLLYPSTYLAKALDPLSCLTTCEQLSGIEAVLGLLKSKLAEDINTLTSESVAEGSVDERWYWAAAVLLDLEHEAKSKDWFEQENLASIWALSTKADEEAAKGWSSHVDEVRELVAGNLELGRTPDDLIDVVAEITLSSPAVAALRSLARVSNSELNHLDLRNEAGRLGHAYLSTFNSPEASAVVRSKTGKPFWRSILEYCANGNLQSSLDEYSHILVESLGLIDKSPEKVAAEVSSAIEASLGLRTTRAKVDIITAKRKIRVDESLNLRNHFAMRFGDQPVDDSSDKTRQDQVRIAFNSPFWPFVLATTSVGQEGLDFHCYCHAIVHWNLPGNPVDLEQREGRIHRYKGHALRKNIAEIFQNQIANAESDPWEQMFDYADKHRPASHPNQLYPYWVIDQGSSKIERHVPTIPLSKEVLQFAKLKNSLVLYRMVFGQNRQEDLISYLRQQASDVELQEFVKACRIDLTPPTHNADHEPNTQRN